MVADISLCSDDRAEFFSLGQLHFLRGGGGGGGRTKWESHSQHEEISGGGGGGGGGERLAYLVHALEALGVDRGAEVLGQQLLGHEVRQVCVRQQQPKVRVLAAGVVAVAVWWWRRRRGRDEMNGWLGESFGKGGGGEWRPRRITDTCPIKIVPGGLSLFKEMKIR